jgi:peptidyl-prolyl cis-trans isomerase B (cyclophilin B)
MVALWLPAAAIADEHGEGAREPEASTGDAAAGRAEDGLRAVIETNRGVIQIELHADLTPATVANFVNLVQRGFYDGLTFHRVVPRQFIQGGSPTGSSKGGPGYLVENEFVRELRHSSPGVVSMSGGPGGNGCQFFITLDARPFLDGQHTVFGRVSEGQEVVEAITRGCIMKRVTIEGDATALLDSLAERVAEWNAILDRRAAGAGDDG